MVILQFIDKLYNLKININQVEYTLIKLGITYLANLDIMLKNKINLFNN